MVITFCIVNRRGRGAQPSPCCDLRLARARACKARVFFLRRSARVRGRIRLGLFELLQASLRSSCFAVLGLAGTCLRRASDAKGVGQCGRPQVSALRSCLGRSSLAVRGLWQCWLQVPQSFFLVLCFACFVSARERHKCARNSDGTDYYSIACVFGGGGRTRPHRGTCLGQEE